MIYVALKSIDGMERTKNVYVGLCEETARETCQRLTESGHVTYLEMWENDRLQDIEKFTP